MLGEDKSAAADAVLGKRPKIDAQPCRGERDHSHGGPFIRSEWGPIVFQFGGGESKNPRLLFDELQTHLTRDRKKDRCRSRVRQRGDNMTVAPASLRLSRSPEFSPDGGSSPPSPKNLDSPYARIVRRPLWSADCERPESVPADWLSPSVGRNGTGRNCPSHPPANPADAALLYLMNVRM